MNTKSTPRSSVSATNSRSFRTFLLVQEFARKEIGLRIAQARHEANGMTQDELADLVGVTTRSVQGYEAGDVVPWKHFERIAEVLQRRIGWFIHGDDAEPVSAEEAQDLREAVDRLQDDVEEILRLLRPAVPGAGSEPR
jgi:transcriptional regulator with XRE-family HTH domain